MLFKEKLTLSEQERNHLFELTKNQSDCELWYTARAPRIIASLFGRIINRIKHIKSFKSSSSLTTAATVMGKQQEPLILSRYLIHKPNTRSPSITVERAVFLVDKEKGWLGASPYAVVLSSDVKKCRLCGGQSCYW